MGWPFDCFRRQNGEVSFFSLLPLRTIVTWRSQLYVWPSGYGSLLRNSRSSQVLCFLLWLVRSARFSTLVLSPVCFWKHMTHSKYCGEDPSLQTWHLELGISWMHPPLHAMKSTNRQEGEGPPSRNSSHWTAFMSCTFQFSCPEEEDIISSLNYKIQSQWGRGSSWTERKDQTSEPDRSGIDCHLLFLDVWLWASYSFSLNLFSHWPNMDCLTVMCEDSMTNCHIIDSEC